MFIDENKIRRASAERSGGFKGVVPKLRHGAKKTPLEIARIAIGWALTIALVAGTAILFINLLSVGDSLAERKAKPQKNDYLQVIFKPKQNE